MLEQIENFFNAMEPLLKGFWFIAIPVSCFFILQTFSSFLGGGDDVGEDSFSETEHSPNSVFDLFSLRNLINFLIGFSYSGISFYGIIANPIALIAVSIIVGLLFVLLYFIMIKQILKLAEDNTFTYKSTLGLNAEVYMNIPTNCEGKGKITVSVKGSLHELDAITDGREIKTGELVSIDSIEPGNLLKVTPLKEQK